MKILSERYNWENSLNDFPAIEYYREIDNLGFKILRFGTITGSNVFDLFIKFEVKDKVYNFAMKDSTGEFRITGEEFDVSGKGLEEFKNLILNISSKPIKQGLFSKLLLRRK